MVLVQCVGQIFALTTLRKRQSALRRPYRMFGYPIPSLIALLGWGYVYYSSGWVTIRWSLYLLAAGIAVFLIWARRETIWPFAKTQIREEFLEAQNRQTA
jgi:fructoselysine transporter